MRLIDIACPNCGCKIHIETERKRGEWDNAPRQLTDRTISKMGIVTVDVDAVKKRLKELGMSRRKLADRIGYADVRSVYRMLKTGKMSETAWERMNTILFDDERRQS